MNSALASTVRSAARSRTLSQGSSQAERKVLHASNIRQAILMPYLSPLMKEGTISSWKKKEGDAFRSGDVLLSVETDYYNVDIQADHPGILGKILMPAGSVGVKVEEVIALVARDPKELTAMHEVDSKTHPTPSNPAPSRSSIPQSTPTPSRSIPRPTVQQRTPTELISPRPRSPTIPFPSIPRRPQPEMTHTMAHKPAAHDTPPPIRPMTTPPSDTRDSGTAIRRMMRDKFAQASHQSSTPPPSSVASSLNPSNKNTNTTKAYFDGIL